MAILTFILNQSPDDRAAYSIGAFGLALVLLGILLGFFAITKEESR
jgi:hypothetical protein